MTSPTRRRDPETGIALLILFVGVPLCVAVLVGLVWLFWTWPYHFVSAAAVVLALLLVHGRVNETNRREPF